MAENNSSVGSNGENLEISSEIGNSSNSNVVNENDSAIEAIARNVQDTLTVAGKKHKFWETQPVGQFKDLGDASLPEGPIQLPTPLSEVKQEPYNLPSLYEWTTCDIDSEETCAEVYSLLTTNYVEDDENMFRFNYSKEFLRWALRPPGYFKSWHIGVRVKVSKKLVAFITGIPAKIRVGDVVVTKAEINFLCVHKKLRSKRLAPVMIKEVTRRVHLENIWQAAYTAGVVLPTPIVTCQYWHRSLNPKKLIDVGFSRLGARMTMSRTIKLYKLPESTVTPGFRKMELRDVPAVTRLLRDYLSQFIVAPDFDEDDVEHWLLPTENVVDICCTSFITLMVIIGPKIVPEEEPKSESKSQLFSIRWMKEITQTFNYSNKIDEDGDGVGTSENKKKKKKKKKKKNGWGMVRIRRTKQFSSDQEQIRYESGSLDYKQIKEATDNFSPKNMIGRGGFGPVYKGILPNKTAIAVKNLSSSSRQGKREFLNEINTISRLRHPNLVTLFGHCEVDNNFLLVYEYMENSCLLTALSGSRPNLKERLDWQTRVKICIGIARGLAFLHEGATFRIVHRDIKLSNVLLDKDLNPKIADFGLAKMDLEENTHISTRVAGTIGYMAPEYAMRGYLTTQADVYSFGVVILELISGKRCSDMPRDDNPHLLDLAIELKKKGDLISLIDENLKPSISVKEAYMVLDLAVLCISCSPKLRPSISEVVKTLEGKMIIKTPILLEPDDLARADSDDDEMTMSNYSYNCIDNSTTPMVTHQGNASTNLENEALILSKYHDLIPNAKSFKSEEHGVEVLSSRHSVKQENNIYTTALGGDSISVAKNSNSRGGEDAARVLSSHDASNEEEDKTYIASHSDMHSHEKDSISGGDESRLLIYTTVSTAEASISNAKESTSSTFEVVTEVRDEAELEYIEPHFEEGKCYIECSDEELKVVCNKWKNSLVGCFLNESGAFEVDEDVLRQAIGKASAVASGGNGYSVFFIGNGHFLLQFSSDEDKIRVLESSGLLHIEGKPMVLRKWDWKLKFDKVEMLKSIPVWVKIYNLPLFLWDSSFLSKVGSALGIPICADQKTMKQQRLDYARVFIQVVASKPLLDTLLISVKGIDYLLNLEYDWRPLRCTYCFTFGHIESKCTLKMKGKKVLE